MANTSMAHAVMEHAKAYYDDGWYVVAECWDLWAVEEELDRQEQLTGAPFRLEASAIAHFASLVPHRSPHRGGMVRGVSGSRLSIRV